MYFCRVTRHAAITLSLILPMAAAGCADTGDPQTPVLKIEQRINNGTPETGHDSVVYILHQSGAGCTGTIIGQRVVLTAKHCVANMDQYGNATSMLSESGFGVWIGASPQVWSWNPKYTVEEVRTTPGNQITDNDIAVLIINGVMSETPYPIVSSYDNSFVGSDVHLIGYGLDRCTGGSSGTKMRTTDSVVGWEGTNSYITQGLGANSGDSGGPVFNLDYDVVGVMVAVPQDYQGNIQCGTTICTRVDKFQSLIQGALEDTGGCYPTGEEICGDGIDQNCDGVIDDGCAAVGEPCALNTDCASGLCTDLGQGMQCVVACNPRNPIGSCVAGYYCKELTCDSGACVPGTMGTTLVGGQCSQDTNCQSLYCRAAADGNSYCSVSCELDQGQCLPNEVCAPMGTTCGACQYSSVYQGQRGIGEICQMGQNCRSGLCIEDEGAFYCSTSCSNNEACPDGFHCRGGHCVRGYLGSGGDPCVLNEDCLPGLVCYGELDYSYCSQQDCESTGCPPGMNCIPVDGGSVCDLSAAPVGTRCEGAHNCLTAGCLTFDGEALCTIQCDRGEPCPPGTYCTEADSGQMACAPNSLEPVTTPPSDGGDKKGCNTAGRGPGGALPLILGLLLLGWRRRR